MKGYVAKSSQVKNAGKLAAVWLVGIIAFLAGFTLGVMV